MIVHLDVSLYSIVDRKYDDIVIITSMTIVGQEINETNISVDMESKLIIDLINNGIDSANQQDSDFTPFLNIINEWYAKDTSKKIRAVMKSKGEAGEHLCTNAPYGYMKDADNKKRWIVDEAAVGQSVSLDRRYRSRHFRASKVSRA